METPTLTSSTPDPYLQRILQTGPQEAAAIEHPAARARHRAAWALRLSAADPEAAGTLLPELSAEPGNASELALTLATDAVRRFQRSPEPYFAQAVELSRALPADERLRVLNALAELTLEHDTRNREEALALLRTLSPEARSITIPGTGVQQPRVLASALVGEALLLLDDPAGLELLEEAEREAEALPARDPLHLFLATALAERQPERAVALVESIAEPIERFEARLQLAERLQPGPERTALLAGADADVGLVAHMRGPEALARLGFALSEEDPERARALFQQVLAETGHPEWSEGPLADADPHGAQARGLQWAGVASAVTTLDREWAGQLFHQAAEAVRQDPEPVRRVTALVLIANEMASSHPREATEIFEGALRDALELTALWELAHAAEVVFRPDRSPYLDLQSALPLVERLLERLADDELMIPGAFGLPEAAQLMSQLDPERGMAATRRWLEAARAAGDTDGMTMAAVALHRLDGATGHAALEEVASLLERRIDCPAMGEFSRQAAELAPELVLRIAGKIPDRRERAEATAAAALHLFSHDPERALTLIEQLEQPASRSLALLMLADRLLGTTDRPLPQPLLEELP